MGTAKRERQKANRQARLAEVEAEAKAEQRETSTRRFGIIAVVIAAIIGLIVLLSVLRGGGDDNADTIAFTPTPAPVVDGPVPTAIPLLADVPSDFAPFEGTGALAAVEPSARNGIYENAPAIEIDTAKSYSAVLNTDVGPIRLELFPDEAPLAVNNFVSLARDGFYDGTGFHRVLEGFMAQGGDPTGTGIGGPGYSFADEFDSGRTFATRGLLAMANAGAGTNGSQFFITFVPTENLTGKHTIFGQLANPEDTVIDNITRRDPNSADADSITPTMIESVQIIEG